MNTMKLTCEMTLYTSYFDYNDNLTPNAILSIFQDVATIHGEQIGVGYKKMLNKCLFWVLSRIKYDVITKPSANQKVKVITWPHEKGKIDFDRDYLICDENDNVLIKGTSKWCVINAVTRALAKSDDVEYNGEFCLDVNYEERFNKSPVLDVNGLTPSLKHQVTFSDLDHNKHMNNTKYANLVLDVINNKDVKHFQINYINECKLNEQIWVYYSQSENLICGYVNEKLIFTAQVN